MNLHESLDTAGSSLREGGRARGCRRCREGLTHAGVWVSFPSAQKSRATPRRKAASPATWPDDGFLHPATCAESPLWPLWKPARRAGSRCWRSTPPWKFLGPRRVQESNSQPGEAFGGRRDVSNPAPWQTAEQRGIRNHASVVLSVAPVWTGLPASRCSAGLSLGTAGLSTMRVQTGRPPESGSLSPWQTSPVPRGVSAPPPDAAVVGPALCLRWGLAFIPACGGVGEGRSCCSWRPKKAFPLCWSPSLPRSLPPPLCRPVAPSFQPFLSPSLSPSVRPSLPPSLPTSLLLRPSL